MLNVRPIQKTEDKFVDLKNFNSAQGTWVVSDLNSKFAIQKILLERDGHLEELAVLRASELWRILARQYCPQWKILNLDLVRILIQEELAHHSLSWAQGPSAAHTITQLMPQFLPLLTQTEDIDLVREWLRQNPESLLQWGHWFELSIRIWQFLQQKKIIPPHWLPALFQMEKASYHWPRHLMVDLSIHLTGLEEVIFHQLSLNGHVDILMPTPYWGSAFQNSLRAYRRWLKPVSEKLSIEKLRHPLVHDVRRFSTELAEMKDAVSTVRIWLEEGCSPSQIALVSPDMEAIWPILMAHLEQEGIPVNKGRNLQFHSLACLQKVLAVMRLEIGLIVKGDLEIATFQGESRKGEFWKNGWSYARFSRLYSHLYEADQIRDFKENILKLNHKIEASTLLHRDELVAWLELCWDKFSSPTFLIKIIKKIGEECPASMTLSAKLWVEWLESLFCKMEEPLRPAQVEGLFCLSVSDLEWVHVERCYFMGLNEEYLSKYSSHGLMNREIEALDKDLGVRVPESENNSCEFEIRWWLDRSFSQVVLSSSACDFLGQPLTPSRLVLVQSLDPKKMLHHALSPGRTRWDEIQQTAPLEIAKLRGWPVEQAQSCERALRQDLGLEPRPYFGGGRWRQVSASTLERYAQCPFIVAAEKLFLLQDIPAVDLDLDAMTRGRLMHAIFEKLTREPRRWSWTQEELEGLVDDQRSQIDFPDLGLWPFLRQRFIEQARRFLAAEKLWRDQFPLSRTVARELKFSAKWDRETSQIVKDTHSSPWIFRGVIDRVDSDGQGEFLIYDYKLSTQNLVQASSWVDKDQFQLALYAQALEEGVTCLGQGTVRGAFYYDGRTLNRSKGFRLEGANHLLPSAKNREKSYSGPEKKQLWERLNFRIQELITHMDQGVFLTQPQDVQQCGKCSWRTVCRAPHLN